VKNRNAEWLARALLVAMFAVAAWAWPSTPAQIPIHWDITGQVNGYGSKFTGLVLMPIIATAGYALIGLTAVLRPEKFQGAAINALSWFRFAYVLVMAGAFGLIVADARGANVNANHVIFPLLAVVTVAVINLVVQSSRNKSAGTTPPCGGVLS
jgi:uncharacterized membrane protein